MESFKEWLGRKSLKMTPIVVGQVYIYDPSNGGEEHVMSPRAKSLTGMPVRVVMKNGDHIEVEDMNGKNRIAASSDQLKQPHSNPAVPIFTGQNIGM